MLLLLLLKAGVLTGEVFDAGQTTSWPMAAAAATGAELLLPRPPLLPSVVSPKLQLFAGASAISSCTISAACDASRSAWSEGNVASLLQSSLMAAAAGCSCRSVFIAHCRNKLESSILPADGRGWSNNSLTAATANDNILIIDAQLQDNNLKPIIICFPKSIYVVEIVVAVFLI